MQNMARVLKSEYAVQRDQRLLFKIDHILEPAQRHAMLLCTAAWRYTVLRARRQRATIKEFSARNKEPRV